MSKKKYYILCLVMAVIMGTIGWKGLTVDNSNPPSQVVQQQK